MALDLLMIVGAGVVALVAVAVVIVWLVGRGGGGRDDVDEGSAR
jgi:hypothetical protein